MTIATSLMAPDKDDSQQLDPVTGQPIEQQIDPATGQPMQQIDPNTGQPVPSSGGNVVTDAAGQVQNGLDAGGALNAADIAAGAGDMTMAMTIFSTCLAESGTFTGCDISALPGTVRVSTLDAGFIEATSQAGTETLVLRMDTGATCRTTLADPNNCTAW